MCSLPCNAGIAPGLFRSRDGPLKVLHLRKDLPQHSRIRTSLSSGPETAPSGWTQMPVDLPFRPTPGFEDTQKIASRTKDLNTIVGRDQLFKNIAEQSSIMRYINSTYTNHRESSSFSQPELD